MSLPIKDKKQKVPSYDEVMKGDYKPPKIPSYDEVMGVPFKKKASTVDLKTGGEQPSPTQSSSNPPSLFGKFPTKNELGYKQENVLPSINSMRQPAIKDEARIVKQIVGETLDKELTNRERYQKTKDNKQAEVVAEVKSMLPKNLGGTMEKDRNITNGRGAYVYNKFLDGLESLGAGSMDLIIKGALADAKLHGVTMIGDKPIEQIVSEWDDYNQEMRGTVKGAAGANIPEKKNEQYGKEFFTKVVGSLAETAAPMVGGFPTLLISGYDQGIQSINSTKEGKDLPDAEKTIFALGIGTATALLDKYSLDKIFGKQSSKVATNLAMKTMADLVKNSKTPITTEMFEQALDTGVKGLKQQLLDKGGKVVSAMKIEGFTEGTQELTAILGEEVMNKIKNKKIFDNTSWKKRVADAVVMGAAGGGILGGIASLGDKTRNYIAEKVSEAKSAEDIEALKTEVVQQAESGNATPEETKAMVDLVGKYAEVNTRIPKEANNRKVVADKIIERDSVEEQIAAKTEEIKSIDPAFRTEAEAEIGLLNERVNELNGEIVAESKSPQKDGTYIIDGNEVTEQQFNEALDKKQVAEYEYNGEDESIIKKLKDVGGKSEVTTTEETITEEPQQGNPEEISQPIELSTEPTVKEETSTVSEKSSDAEIEKRMAEIETSKVDFSEFDKLEKIMEKRERDSVFGVPLDKVNESVDALMKKEKEMPNGFGSFIQKRDAAETKDVANKYSNPKEITDADLKNDFKEALMGKPATWYADGLKLRESMKEASNRGIDINDMLKEVEKEFTKDGFSIEEAKSTIAGYLEPIFSKGKPQPTNEAKANELQQPTEVESTTNKEVDKVGEAAAVVEEKAYTKNALDRAEAKKIYADIKQMDEPQDAAQIALEYVANGGKISETSINEVAGTVKRASLNTGKKELKSTEAKARDYSDKAAKNIDAIAHSLWESSGQRISETDIRDALMDVVLSHNTRLDAGKTYLERYSAEYNEKKLQEKFYQEHLEEIAAEEKAINEWLNGEEELLIDAMADEKFVTNLIEKYESETKGEDKQSPTKTESSTDKGISSETSTKKTEAGEPPIDPPVPPVVESEGAFVEPKRTKFSHKGLQEVATEFGLNDITSREKVSDLELFKRADETISKWQSDGTYQKKVNELIDKAKLGEIFSPEQNVIMAQHIANMREKTAKVREKFGINSPEYNKALQELQNITTIGQKVRSDIGAALRVPNISRTYMETLDEAMAAKMEAAGVDVLTEKQKAEVEGLFNEYKKRAEVAEAKLNEANQRLSEFNAEQALKKGTYGKKTTPKTKEEFKEQRKSLKEKLQQQIDEYKAAGQKLGISSDGGTESFIISTKIAKTVLEIVRSHVAEVGVDLKEVTKKTFEDVRDLLKGISEKDIHDIIAGEYNEKRKTRNQLAADMRDVKDEAKYINQLESLLAGEEPKSEREKIKRNQQITELKDKIKDFRKEEVAANKFYGDKDLARKEAAIDKLEDELDRLKERKEKEQSPTVKKEISDREVELKKEIAAERKKWNDENSEAENVIKLTAELDRVQSRIDKPATNPKEKRELSNREKALKSEIKSEQEKWNKEKKINQLEKELDRLKKRIPKDKKEKQESVGREKELKDEIAAERQKIAAEEREANKFYREEYDADVKKLMAIKKQNKAKAAKIMEDIAKGNFEKNPKIPFMQNKELKAKYPKLFNETLDAIVAREDAKHEMDIALYKEQQSKRNKGQKVLDFLGAGANTTKKIVTGVDDSALGIQTLAAMIARPVVGGRAIKLHAMDAFSQKRFERTLAELHNSPDYDLMVKSGLDITEPKSLLAEKKEEIFSGNTWDIKFKLKGKEYKVLGDLLKPFERAFTSLGNGMRVIAFRTIADKLAKEGRTFENSPQVYKDLANMLNTETGRGKQNEYIQKAAELVTKGIWSPRLMASRLNMLGISDAASLLLSKAGTKGYYSKLDPRIRKEALIDLVKFSTGVLALSYLTAWALGGELDDDPTSQTFMDVKVGDKSYNLSGGFSQYIRFVAQSLAGGKTSNGQFNKFGRFKDRGTNALHFFRGKVTPITGVGIDLVTGTDFVGNPVEMDKEIKKLVIPLSLGSLASGLENDGASSLFTTTFPNFVGVNVKDKQDFTEQDLDVPEWRFLSDKGLRLTKKSKESLKPVDVDGKLIEVTEDKYKEFLKKREEYVRQDIEKLMKGEGYIEVEKGVWETLPKSKLKDITYDEIKGWIMTKTNQANDKAMMDVFEGEQATQDSGKRKIETQ